MTDTGLKAEVDPTVVRLVCRTAHGNHPVDVPYVSQITDNLWQGGCYNGLLLPKFFRHVISLYPWEQYKVKHELSSLLSVRMFDSLDQSFDQVTAIADWVNECRSDGPVLVHCQAGLNRSALIVCYAMMTGECMLAEDAIALVREKRSYACLCNPVFEDWLKEH